MKDQGHKPGGPKPDGDTWDPPKGPQPDDNGSGGPPAKHGTGHEHGVPQPHPNEDDGA